MEKIIKDILFDLHCSDKEIKFFVTNYGMGAASINEIAKKARLERSTAYLIAEKLLTKNLLIEDNKKYKKRLITAEPKALLRMHATRQRSMGRHELAMQEHLEELQSLYQASTIRPKVMTFEGNAGVLSIWRDILTTTQEVLLWTNQETESNFFTWEYHKLFIKERLKKKIPLRVLAVNNQKGFALAKNDKSSLRLTKILPATVHFSAETYIYGNKIAILDYNKDIIGVIIESEQISQTQRAIFELNWSQLEPSFGT